MSLEDTIMRELGFVQHHSWSEGSRSCRGARRTAATKLPDVLRSHGLRPNVPLMNAVMAVALWGDIGDDTLHKTWVACSHAIRAQINGGGDIARETAYIRRNLARQLAGGLGWMDKDGRHIRHPDGRAPRGSAQRRVIVKLRVPS